MKNALTDRRLWRSINRAKEIFLFLDFDGTMVPIEKRPDAVRLSAETCRLINALTGVAGVRIAVISGRSLSDLRPRVGIDSIGYAGSHGMEIWKEGQQVEQEWSGMLRVQHRRLVQILAKAFRGMTGVLLEVKPRSVAVHYRMVPAGNIKRFHRVLGELAPVRAEQAGDFKMTSGKKVVEFVPVTSWNKGVAVLSFLREAPAAFAIFVGDDATDETAFAVLRGKGAGIRVGPPSVASLAGFHLANVREVGVFLDRLRFEKEKGSSAPVGGLKRRKKKRYSQLQADRL